MHNHTVNALLLWSVLNNRFLYIYCCIKLNYTVLTLKTVFKLEQIIFSVSANPFLFLLGRNTFPFNKLMQKGFNILLLNVKTRMWSMSKVKVGFLIFILLSLCLSNLNKFLINLKTLLNLEQNHVISCICFCFSFVKWLLFPSQSLWHICHLVSSLSDLSVVETSALHPTGRQHFRCPGCFCTAFPRSPVV